MATKKEEMKNLQANVKEMLNKLGVSFQEEISLCLSDIPKEKMTKGNNGKIYIDLCVAARKEPDQWGRDLKVWVKQKQAEREAKEEKSYVGSGKTIIFASEQYQQPVSDEDLRGLPFIPDSDPHAKDNIPF